MESSFIPPMKPTVEYDHFEYWVNYSELTKQRFNKEKANARTKKKPKKPKSKPKKNTY